MQYVFESKNTKGSQRLMLLAIADRCDDEGTCYPGVPYLAEKCNVARRTALTIIHKLEKKGEIRVIEGGGCETGHGATNRYVMTKFRESNNLKNDDSEFRPVGLITSDDSITPTPDKTITQSQVVSQDNPKDFASIDADDPFSLPGPTTATMKDKLNPRFFPQPNLLVHGENDVAEIVPVEEAVEEKVSDHAQDNAYELSLVIPTLLNLHNGREWNIAHMLSGTSKKNGYKEYASHFVGDKMVTPNELQAIADYYRENCPDVSMLASPETIADWVGKYRNREAEPKPEYKPSSVELPDYWYAKERGLVS